MLNDGKSQPGRNPMKGWIRRRVLRLALVTTALLALLALRRWWLLTGIVLGLLALTRENALLLAVPILLWIAFDKKLYRICRTRPRSATRRSTAP